MWSKVELLVMEEMKRKLERAEVAAKDTLT
jgi:hypothetical protein